MSRQLKILVIGFLANLPKDKYEQFNEAFELYRKSPNKNFGIERRLNSAGYSEEGLKNLLYDLQHLYEIKDAEIKGFVSKTENSDNKISIGESVPKYLLDMNEEQLREWCRIETVERGIGLEEVIELAKADDIAVIVNILSEELELAKEQTNDDLLDEEGKALKAELDSSIDEKQKLREEFPFLDAKDCPDVMHVVVGRKIAAYNRYSDLHAKIQEVTATDENSPELQGLAKESEEAFSENRSLYDELNYYKENGEILGKHPLFFELVAKKEVDAMTNEDMVKFKGATATYLSRKRKDLEKNEKDIEKVASINDAIFQRELKLKLVDARLGIKNE